MYNYAFMQEQNWGKRLIIDYFDIDRARAPVLDQSKIMYFYTKYGSREGSIFPLRNSTLEWKCAMEVEPEWKCAMEVEPEWKCAMEVTPEWKCAMELSSLACRRAACADGSAR